MNHNITVVIPSYNSSSTIERALLSVAKQKEGVSDVVVIDDASDAETVVLLKKIENKKWPFNLLVIYLDENRGASYARNCGIKESNTEWIAFLDSDDSWHQEKIQIQMSEMLKSNALFSGHLTVFKGSGSDHVRGDSVKKYFFNDFLISNRVNTPSVIIHRSIVSYFDVSMSRSEDYDLWLRVLKVTDSCLFINRELAYVYKPLYGAAGLSGSLLLMEKGELRAYRNLRLRGDVSFFKYCILVGLSLIKFLKRVLTFRFCR